MVFQRTGSQRTGFQRTEFQETGFQRTGFQETVFQETRYLKFGTRNSVPELLGLFIAISLHWDWLFRSIGIGCSRLSIARGTRSTRSTRGTRRISA
jgi:hypothetical protein